MAPPGAGKDGVPLQTLFGFERVHVRAGETVTVSIVASMLDFTMVKGDGQRVAWPGKPRDSTLHTKHWLIRKLCTET